MNMPAMEAEKTPQYVHCAACEYEWVAVYLPAPAEVAARFLKAATQCPRCLERDIRIGQRPKATDEGRPAGELFPNMVSKGRDGVVLAVQVPRELAKQVRERAAIEDVPVSTIIRRFIRSGFAGAVDRQIQRPVRHGDAA